MTTPLPCARGSATFVLTYRLGQNGKRIKNKKKKNIKEKKTKTKYLCAYSERVPHVVGDHYNYFRYIQLEQHAHGISPLLAHSQKKDRLADPTTVLNNCRARADLHIT